MNHLKINDKELKILEQLAEAYHPDEWGAYSFAPLSRITKLTVPEVRRACRSLAKKGLAKFERTLWSEDGPAGAGYRATEEGAAYLNPCALCQRRATYDYSLDVNGKHDWDAGYDHVTARRIQECDEHYQQSAEKPQPTSLSL